MYSGMIMPNGVFEQTLISVSPKTPVFLIRHSGLQAAALAVEYFSIFFAAPRCATMIALPERNDVLWKSQKPESKDFVDAQISGSFV